MLQGVIRMRGRDDFAGVKRYSDSQGIQAGSWFVAHPEYSDRGSARLRSDF